MLADRWGATGAEVAAHYGCDDVVARPVAAAWRAVTVDAAPDRVWSWVCQIRLAPYSYDWIDNFGRRSPQELRGLPEPSPGEPFTASAGRPLGRVIAVQSGVELTARIMGAVTSYRVTPAGDATRLVMKIVMPGYRPLAPLLVAGDWVMARRQLLNLKRLAESR